MDPRRFAAIAFGGVLAGCSLAPAFERSSQLVKGQAVLLAGIALGLILLNGASAEKKPD